MVLRLISCSPVTGLFCHRRLRTDVVPKPGRADITSANLTPASGRQDHTTSPYAATSLVRSLSDRSRAHHPPCDRFARKTLPRPPHPAPTFVTMANAPLMGRDGGRKPLIWDRDQPPRAAADWHDGQNSPQPCQDIDVAVGVHDSHLRCQVIRPRAHPAIADHSGSHGLSRRPHAGRPRAERRASGGKRVQGA
jgi:hypothetical protein